MISSSRRTRILRTGALILCMGASMAPAVEHVALTVTVPPAPVKVGSASRLVYELRVANDSRDTIVLRRLHVRDAGRHVDLATFGGDTLARRIAPHATAPTVADRLTLPPNGGAVIFIEIATAALPDTIEHRVEATSAHATTPILTTGAQVALSRTPPLVLSPPLRGGPWAAIYDPSWERGHRRVFYTVADRARLPGRFAIDFIKLDDAGHYARDDEDRPSHWLGYGADVLAVADGIVAAARDGMAESESVAANPKHAPTDAAGNFIALALGDGRFAFFEHLRPNSLRVRAGDRVRRGDVIASLGYTGDTTGPHLHFHVADGGTPLGAEGVPFVFTEFELLGAFDSLDAFGRAGWQPLTDPTRSQRMAEMPGPRAVVRFAMGR